VLQGFVGALALVADLGVVELALEKRIGDMVQGNAAQILFLAGRS
jgi:hypothetical protein